MSANHDPVTGEIIEEVGADGRQRYPSVRNLTDLILMLNDGGFNAVTAEDIAEFSSKLEQMGCDTGKKIKGKLTLSIEVEREADGVYFFTPSLKFTVPAEKHGRTIGWVTADNRFTPNKPNQGNLFGTVREVISTRQVREI